MQRTGIFTGWKRLVEWRTKNPAAANRLASLLARSDKDLRSNCKTLSCQSLGEANFRHGLTQLGNLGSKDALTLLTELEKLPSEIKIIDSSRIETLNNALKQHRLALAKSENPSLQKQVAPALKIAEQEINLLSEMVQSKIFSKKLPVLGLYNNIVDTLNTARQTIFSDTQAGGCEIARPVTKIKYGIFAIPLSQFINLFKQQDFHGAEPLTIYLEKYQKDQLPLQQFTIIHRLLLRIHRQEISGPKQLQQECHASLRKIEVLKMLGPKLEILKEKPILSPTHVQPEPKPVAVAPTDIVPAAPSNPPQLDFGSRKLNRQIISRIEAINLLLNLLDHYVQREGTSIVHLKIQRLQRGTPYYFRTYAGLKAWFAEFNAHVSTKNMHKQLGNLSKALEKIHGYLKHPGILDIDKTQAPEPIPASPDPSKPATVIPAEIAPPPSSEPPQLNFINRELTKDIIARVETVNLLLMLLDHYIRKEGTSIAHLKIRKLKSGKIDHFRTYAELKSWVAEFNKEVSNSERLAAPSSLLRALKSIHGYLEHLGEMDIAKSSIFQTIRVQPDPKPATVTSTGLAPAAPPPEPTPPPKPEPVSVSPAGVIPIKQGKIQRLKKTALSILEMTSLISDGVRRERTKIEEDIMLATAEACEVLADLVGFSEKLSDFEAELTADPKMARLKGHEHAGFVHELIRLQSVALRSSPSDPLTEVEKDFGAVDFYQAKIVNGRIKHNGYTFPEPAIADGYKARSKTIVEVKLCNKLEWLVNGSFKSGEEEKKVEDFLNQARKYSELIKKGQAAKVEYHITSDLFKESDIHPSVVRELEKILPGVEISLYDDLFNLDPKRTIATSTPEARSATGSQPATPSSSKPKTKGSKQTFSRTWYWINRYLPNAIIGKKEDPKTIRIKMQKAQAAALIDGLFEDLRFIAEDSKRYASDQEQARNLMAQINDLRPQFNSNWTSINNIKAMTSIIRRAIGLIHNR